ncbi:hypothetical protein H257_19368 [Aphanomyces astaci]|uniref:Uncharacterized protein n=1 Tax=Aphanomyces astaci TaxID=112090 RepID=W4F899_APHAT|nr:hypothetical protein H257_19368 [Aphanomyces astaci]ETV63700.1 hypothetical protein H257_19368 [Aphanomyces astaci]|eukprot:XP_009846816.1 hypothetical protein H257_19368 [Aphanomyces astaci]
MLSRPLRLLPQLSASLMARTMSLTRSLSRPMPIMTASKSPASPASTVALLTTPSPCALLSSRTMSATPCVLALTAQSLTNTALPLPRSANATSTIRRALPIDVVTTAMIAEGLVARVVSVVVVAQVAMTVTVVVVITVATVDMDVMTVALGVALAVETAAVIVLAVKTAVLVVMIVTPATLLMMQSTVTLDAVVLRLLPTTPSYHPPSTVSSKSLNRLACYPKFLLRALPHSHTAAIQVKAINVEAGKKLAAQCSAAHTFLVSAISVNLRRLNQTTVCPYSLFELLKFTEESCIDTLAVELTDLVKRYRVSMTPPSFNLLDASVISSIDYDTHIWNYHTLCAMSGTFINDKELWEVVTNYVSTARAAGTPVVVDDVWVSLRRILTNRLQRASALGDHGSVATIQSRSQFAAVTHAVAVPAPPPTVISQPDGSYHVLNAFTIPAYAHHDCVKIPGKSCFYCGVANHTLPVCPTLKSDIDRNTMQAQTQTSTIRRALPIDVVTTAMVAEGQVARVVSVAVVAQVVMIVTVVVVITVATVDMDVMTVATGVALVVETADVIVLAVTTTALVVMTVTPATLLMMQSTVTLDAVVLRLLPTTPSYHPPSTVSSKSLNRLACYQKFLLRALPHCSTYLHRRRALHYLRLLRLLRLCHWRQLPSNRPHCQPTTGLPLTPVISTSLKSRLTSAFLAARSDVDDIRPCTLRLNFGQHCSELQFNRFSVRQASDDDITVRFPARDVCEITTSFGDVLNAPNNAMGLYSFPSQPKVVPIDPHHGESLHISDLTRFRAMMASFETALRTFSTKYSGFSTFNDQLHMFAYSSVLRYAPITHRPSMVPKSPPPPPLTTDSVYLSVAHAMLGTPTTTRLTPNSQQLVLRAFGTAVSVILALMLLNT